MNDLWLDCDVVEERGGGSGCSCRLDEIDGIWGVASGEKLEGGLR